jgi:hypothetical protein
MICGFCGREFAEDRAQPACQACPIAVTCKAVRCPHCGYENPVVPAWLERLRGRRQRRRRRGRGA